MFMKPAMLGTLIGGLLLATMGRAADRPVAKPLPARPNILVIMADDVGITNVGAYSHGMMVPTPNIDQIAREGMLFTDHYAEPSCTPCPAGSYCPADAGAPVLCAPGTFAANQQEAACAECGAGFFSSTFGNTECMPCAPGTHASGTGQVVCTPCAPGTFNAVTAQSGCSACPPGTSSPSGAFECTANDAGADASAIADAASDSDAQAAPDADSYADAIADGSSDANAEANSDATASTDTSTDASVDATTGNGAISAAAPAAAGCNVSAARSETAAFVALLVGAAAFVRRRSSKARR